MSGFQQRTTNGVIPPGVRHSRLKVQFNYVTAPGNGPFNDGYADRFKVIHQRALKVALSGARIDGEDLFVARKVDIGPSINGKVEVVRGLAEGEQVVVKGALLLDGAAEQLL